MGLLKASRIVTVMLEVAVPSATTGEVPAITDVPASGAPATKETVPPDLTTGVAMESVFNSAFVDVRVQVEIPETSVAEQAL